MLRLRATAGLASAQLVAWGILYYAFSALLARGHAVATGLSTALLASALATGLLARATARFGTRLVMIAGAVAGTVSLAGLAVLPTSLVLWALLGASQTATLYDVAFIAIAGWQKGASEARRALVVVTAVGGLAGTIFVPLVGMLAGALSWRSTLASLAAALALTVLPIYATLPDVRPRAAATRALARVALTPMSLAFALHAFATTGASVHLANAFVQSGRSFAGAAALVALMGVSQVGGRLVLLLLGLRRLARGVDSPAARVVVALVAQALGLALTESGADAVAAVGIVAFGAANGALTVDRNVTILERHGAEDFAGVAGAIATVTSFAKAAAPFVVATMIAALGGRPTFFVLAASLGFSAFIFFASIGTPLRLWRRGHHGC